MYIPYFYILFFFFYYFILYFNCTYLRNHNSGAAAQPLLFHSNDKRQFWLILLYWKVVHKTQQHAEVPFVFTLLDQFQPKYNVNKVMYSGIMCIMSRFLCRQALTIFTYPSKATRGCPHTHIWCRCSTVSLCNRDNCKYPGHNCAAESHPGSVSMYWQLSAPNLQRVFL